MVLIRPRLNDFHQLPFTQEEVDFAIPFLDEDVPLYVDPFLLWKSPSQQDNSLHTAIVNSFNHLGYLVRKNKEPEAIEMLIRASECNEVGLGTSRTRKGRPIGKSTAAKILNVFHDIPEIGKSGFIHFEEIQLIVDNIAKDRVSDIACTFMKSFLIDFTIEQCMQWKIPIHDTPIDVYDYRSQTFKTETIGLPRTPETERPVLLVPKRWLRAHPWISFDDYVGSFYVPKVLGEGETLPERVKILNFNRQQYGLISAYVRIRENQSDSCRNDPLFSPIPVTSARRKLAAILALPTGKMGNADKRYEDNVCQLLSSAFYPELDFAAEQSRTDSGTHIRDLIFYNNRSYDFLGEIYDAFESRQLVFELKNVAEITRDHINQLNRYIKDQFGRFGVIVTRNPLKRAVFRNTIDLWSGQRTCILCVDDSDLRQVTELYGSRQRLPIDVLKKKYVEFTRACPS